MGPDDHVAHQHAAQAGDDVEGERALTLPEQDEVVQLDAHGSPRRNDQRRERSRPVGALLGEQRHVELGRLGERVHGHEVGGLRDSGARVEEVPRPLGSGQARFGCRYRLRAGALRDGRGSAHPSAEVLDLGAGASLGHRHLPELLGLGEQIEGGERSCTGGSERGQTNPDRPWTGIGDGHPAAPAGSSPVRTEPCAGHVVRPCARGGRRSRARRAVQPGGSGGDDDGQRAHQADAPTRDREAPPAAQASGAIIEHEAASWWPRSRPSTGGP